MSCLDKFWFLNIKLTIILVVVANIYIVFHILVIGDYLDKTLVGELRVLFWPVFAVSAGIVPIILLFIIGVLGKLIYSKKTIKCKCGNISRADKWYCGKCGERLLDDEVIKLDKKKV